MLQEDAMWDEKKKKKKMGSIFVCNNPLNLKFHI